MKAIKTEEDIELLKKANHSEKVIDYIGWYYHRLFELFDHYVPKESGWVVLIEKDDPLTDTKFLEDDLGIRCNQTLVTVLKEYVDYDLESNLFTILVLFSDDFGMTFLLPKEEWIGEELLQQLTKFANVPIT